MPMTQTDTPQSFLLCAGGTGGHLFPAVALAQDLMARGYKVHMATDDRGKKYLENYKDIPVTIIKSAPLNGKPLKKLANAMTLGLGYTQSHQLLMKLKPAAVIGFGGYPCVPPLLAAQHRKIPTILHEQNAVLGVANKFLFKNAARIALSLPSEKLQSEAVRTVVTGNPVRPEIAHLATAPYPALPLTGPIRLLVLGGSLGARVFSDVVPFALAAMPTEIRQRLQVVQQCREEDISRVRDLYQQEQINADLRTFFDDVPEQLAACHLFIGRSGASTVAELAAAGRPAIFVPYPHHADQQQLHNARVLEKEGGAFVFEENSLTSEELRQLLLDLFANPSKLFHAAEAARSCGKPDAARKLGNLVVAIAAGWDQDK